MWRIQPGWSWVYPPGARGEPLRAGILEHDDNTHRAEARLLHEIYGSGIAIRSALAKNPGVGVVRETELPIVVRCPKCRRLRYVPADVMAHAIQPIQRRLVQIVRS